MVLPLSILAILAMNMDEIDRFVAESERRHQERMARLRSLTDYCDDSDDHLRPLEFDDPFPTLSDEELADYLELLEEGGDCGDESDAVIAALFAVVLATTVSVKILADTMTEEAGEDENVDEGGHHPHLDANPVNPNGEHDPDRRLHMVLRNPSVNQVAGHFEIIPDLNDRLAATNGHRLDRLLDARQELFIMLNIILLRIFGKDARDQLFDEWRLRHGRQLWNLPENTVHGRFQRTLRVTESGWQAVLTSGIENYAIGDLAALRPHCCHSRREADHPRDFVARLLVSLLCRRCLSSDELLDDICRLWTLLGHGGPASKHLQWRRPDTQ